MAKQRGCYLLHFQGGKVADHAGHYLGWSTDIPARLREHEAGTGGRLPAVALARGLVLVLARTWLGASRTDERKLKNCKNAPRFCPLCRAAGRRA